VAREEAEVAKEEEEEPMDRSLCRQKKRLLERCVRAKGVRGKGAEKDQRVCTAYLVEVHSSKERRSLPLSLTHTHSHHSRTHCFHHTYKSERDTARCLFNLALVLAWLAISQSPLLCSLVKNKEGESCAEYTTSRLQALVLQKLGVPVSHVDSDGHRSDG